MIFIWTIKEFLMGLQDLEFDRYVHNSINFDDIVLIFQRSKAIKRASASYSLEGVQVTV